MTFIHEKIVPLIHGYIRMQEGQGSLLHDDEQPIHLRLMQDSAPGHAAGTTIADFEDRGVEVIKWPPFSPDLNPIEKVWKKMKDYQDKKWGDDYCSLTVERERIAECWEVAVTDEYLEELTRSMPERCADVIAAEGGPTKW